VAKTRWLGKGVWGLVPLSLVVAMPAAAIECGAAIAGWETWSVT